MSDEFYDRVLAYAVRPERPSAAVEEALLLRLEQEVERRQIAVIDDGDADGGDEDAHDGDLSAVVVEIDTLAVKRGVLKLSQALLAAAVVLVIGVSILAGRDGSSVKTGVADDTPPTIQVDESIEPEADPISLVDAACAGVLPNLAPGTIEMIGNGTTPEAEALVRERIADLRTLVDALDEPIGALEIAKPALTNSWDDVVGELTNSELLLNQGVFNNARYTVPSLTADLHQLLDELVAIGADSCGSWPKPTNSSTERQTDGE